MAEVSKPIRMTKAILDKGADYTEDVYFDNYGVPMVATIRTLSEDEYEEITSKTVKPMDAMTVVKATGKSIAELKGMTPDEWGELVMQAVESGRIDPATMHANNARYELLVRAGVVDEVIRNNPEKLRFGVKALLGSRIEAISTSAPKEIEDFLRPLMASEQPSTSSQDTSSQVVD